LVEGVPAFDPDSASRAFGFSTDRTRVQIAERRGGENLFLRKQLALFQERKLRPHRADDSTRWLMNFLSRWFDWRSALVVVKPDTRPRGICIIGSVRRGKGGSEGFPPERPGQGRKPSFLLLIVTT